MHRKGVVRVKQYCRYCCYLIVGDAIYCSMQDKTMTEATAKSVNRCHDYALNPIDAFGENENGYRPRRQDGQKKKEQCDGQMKLNGLI